MQKMAYSIKPYRPLLRFLRNKGRSQSADETDSDGSEDDVDDGEEDAEAEEEAKVSGGNARLGWTDQLRSVFGFAAVRRESPA